MISSRPMCRVGIFALCVGFAPFACGKDASKKEQKSDGPGTQNTTGAAGPDTTPPSLADYSPKDGSTLASVKGIRFQFDDDIDPTSLNATLFEVKDHFGNVVSGSVTLADPKTVSFTPSVPFSFRNRYQANFKAGIKNKAGLSYVEQKSWSFETGPMPAAISVSNVFVVLASGSVKASGSNGIGQMASPPNANAGSETVTPKTIAADALPNVRGLVATTSGTDNNGGPGFETTVCALLAEKGVKCWGANAQGQTGRDSIASAAFPTAVKDLPLDIRAVSLGGSNDVDHCGNRGPSAGKPAHACAVTTSGSVYCWGSNQNGQLGIGAKPAECVSAMLAPETYRLKAVAVPGLSEVVDVAAGGAHTCVVQKSGGVKCWGANDAKQSGFAMDALSPQDVPGVSTAYRIVAGESHTCILTTQGGVKCWGDNTYGQLGLGATGTGGSSVTDVPGLTTGVIDIGAGRHHTCALTAQRNVKCWGSNRYQQSGREMAEENVPSPNDIPLAGGAKAVGLAVGGFGTCVLSENFQLQCLGNNYYAHLGRGKTFAELPQDKSFANVALSQGEFVFSGN